MQNHEEARQAAEHLLLLQIRDMSALHVEPLTAANVRSCRVLWSDAAAYSEAELDGALRRVATAVNDETARGVLIRTDRRVVAYGVTAFVSDVFLDGYLSSPFPQVTKHLLLNVCAASPTVLSESAIAAANAGAGLSLVVLSCNFVPDGPQSTAALGLLMQTFQDIHRGFRIQRIMQEAIGDHCIDVMRRSGTWELSASFGDIGGIPGLRSVVATLTREQAIRGSSPLLPMFMYTPPRIGFTRAEQAVLRIAMLGGTDVALARRLGISVTALKARWNRIYARVAARAPDIIGDAGPRNQRETRGSQIRHLLLAYLRRCPGELTPYVDPAELTTGQGSSAVVSPPRLASACDCQTAGTAEE